MKIEFFGHSIAGKNKSEKFDTFVDRIINKYSTSGPDNIGIAKCSEERILYNLKKTKDIVKTTTPRKSGTSTQITKSGASTEIKGSGTTTELE